MTVETGSFQVSPNSVLTNKGLRVQSRHQDLRHRRDFGTFAFACGAAVADVLAQLFPTAVAVPLPDGHVRPSGESSWSHYSRTLISLHVSDLDSPEFIEHGKVLMQWCVAAVAAARVLRHPVTLEAEFMAVEYLAMHGGEALACSISEWDAYLEWVQAGPSSQSLSNLQDGAGPSPRPQPIRVTAPWPTALGASLGSSPSVDEGVFQYACEIYGSKQGTWASDGVNCLKVELCIDLRERLDAEVAPEAGPVPGHGMQVTVGAKTYQIRASRVEPLPGEFLYNFRLLPNTMPDLTSLMAVQNA